jgi:hypothetical protein
MHMLGYVALPYASSCLVLANFLTCSDIRVVDLYHSHLGWMAHPYPLRAKSCKEANVIGIVDVGKDVGDTGFIVHYARC